jgi:hypothetical protein
LRGWGRPHGLTAADFRQAARGGIFEAVRRYDGRLSSAAVQFEMPRRGTRRDSGDRCGKLQGLLGDSLGSAVIGPVIEQQTGATRLRRTFEAWSAFEGLPTCRRGYLATVMVSDRGGAG